MRRKSDRTASKKSKPSPEKKEKVEKVKRPRTRRNKQSATSESESTEEPVQAVQKVEVVESQIEVPPKSVKEDSPEETQEVWHVKTTTGSSGDVGEIKKLKICLARPPSTPERADRSPRSKRKHSRATSSSDTQSIEGEEKKKTRHRSKRGTFEAKDISEKNLDSQGDEAEAEVPAETAKILESTKSCKEPITKETAVDETPMSTTCEDDKIETSITKTTIKTELKDNESTENSAVQSKSSDADTTVVSPKTQVEDDEEEKEFPGRIEKRTSERKGKEKSETKAKVLLEIVKEESSESEVKASNKIVQKTSSLNDEKTPPVKDEKTSSVTDEKASSVTAEKASSVTDENASSVTAEKTSSVTDEKASAVTDEKASAVTTEKASSVRAEKASSVTDEKASPVSDVKASSVIVKISSLQKEEKVLPESKEKMLDDEKKKESSDKEGKGKTKGEENKSSEVKKTEDVKEKVKKSEDIKEEVKKTEDIKEEVKKTEDIKKEVKKTEDIKEEVKKTEDIKDEQKKPPQSEQALSKKEEKIVLPKTKHSLIRKRSLSAEKSEILELHADESRCESSEMCLNESQDSSSETKQVKRVIDVLSSEVSINQPSTEISGKTASSGGETVSTNENNVLESTKNVETEKQSTVTAVANSNGKGADATKENHQKPLDIIQTQSSEQQDIHNGQATPMVTSRKRRWGSRPSRLSTQKSITISTDVLKEIIPDVKPVEFDEVIEETIHKRVELSEKFDRPVLPKIVIDNTESVEPTKKEQRLEERDKENVKSRETHLASARKISIVKENDSIITRPPSPPRNKQSNILYITNLVRPFTLPQLKNLLQRTGRIMENGFCIDGIKSKCFVKYETEDQATETRHALHGVTWPVSNPKTLHVDFSTEEDFNKAQENVGTENTPTSTIPGTVEDWLREQDMKREKGDTEKPWERKAAMREWDMGKNEKGKEEARPDKMIREERPLEKRRHRTPERSPEPARKFKKKEEEAPAKLLDDLFRKTKTTPCIYWLPLSAETIAVKEEQRRQHMAEHERRLQELRRNRRH